MKDEYLYWKRFEDQTKTQIENAEGLIMISKALLITAKREIAKLERAGKVPKFKDDKKPS